MLEREAQLCSLTEPATTQAASRGRRAAGVGAGFAVGCISYAIADLGLLPGGLLFVIFLCVLPLIPIGDTLPRRFAVNGCLLMGWGPLLWWFVPPLAISRGAGLFGLALGVVTAVVVRSPSPVRRFRNLLPSVSPADALLIAAPAVAFAAVAPWAYARTPQRALEALLPGADNYPHFHMFSTIRSRGATLDALPGPPDGSGWAFDSYPQAFHALVATLSEILAPGPVGDVDLLPVYTQSVVALIILGTVTLTAALLTAPTLRARAGIAAPVAVVAWVAYLWEPGQKVIFDGFANFWLGCIAASCAILLGITVPRCLSMPETISIAGLLVLIVHTWTPLVLIAAPAGLSLLVGASAGISRMRGWGAVVAGLAAAFAIGKAVLALFAYVDVSYLVTTTTGGLRGTSPAPTFSLIVLGLYVAASFRAWTRSSPGVTELAIRVRRSGLSILLGVLVLGSLMVAQLATVGSTQYYFLKYFMGFELILAGFVPVVCGLLLAALLPRPSGRNRFLLPAAATLLASQTFGFFPGGVGALRDEGLAGTGSVKPSSRPAVAAGVLSAVEVSPNIPNFSWDYIAMGKAATVQPFYGDAWFHSIDGSLSNDVFARYGLLRVTYRGSTSLIPIARSLLLSDKSLRVIVPSDYREKFREHLPREAAGRLVGLDGFP